MSEEKIQVNFLYDFPNYINYGQGDKNFDVMGKMNELISEPKSPFQNYDMADVFLFCMSYAYATKMEPIKPPSASNGMPGSRFKEDRIIYLMKALAIDSTQKIETAIYAKEVVKICESYAYVGFKKIYEKIKEYNNEGYTNEKILEQLIRDCESKKNKKDLNE